LPIAEAKNIIISPIRVLYKPRIDKDIFVFIINNIN